MTSWKGFWLIKKVVTTNEKAEERIKLERPGITNVTRNREERKGKGKRSKREYERKELK